MSPDAPCPSAEALRRSLDPDDPMPEAERRRIEAHVDRCSQGCKVRLDALLRGNTVTGADEGTSILDRPGAAAEAPDEPLPPRMGRYEIVGRLGAGGMGVVLRGRDPQLGRDVAVKVPSFHGPADARTEARRRFVREARAAAAVRHAHVCPIYDVGEQDGRPFVVMALIEGESLAERLRRQGRFEEPHEAVDLLLKVADALARVHAARVVHRDLKPGNILLDRAGEPFLADFGLALPEDGERFSSANQIAGTPAYMAPEQISPELGLVGPQTDQYSLGVVLYQMLTGRLPFEGSAVAVIYQIASQPVPRPSQFRPGLDPELEAVCLKATAKKPADRFGSVQEFASALEAYAHGAGRRLAEPAPPSAAAAAAPKQDLAPKDDETRRLYLAAWYHLEKRTEEAHRKSIATYYQVLDRDPTFAPAWAGLAYAYHALSVWGYASPTVACPKAKGAAFRALALAPSLFEAQRVLAILQMEYEWDLVGAERDVRAALALKPDDAAAHQVHGKCLACQGRHSDAIAAFRRAEELDPLSAMTSTDLGRHGFLLARRYDEAVLQLRKVLQTDPDFWLANRHLGWAYLLQGKNAEALAAFATARRLQDNGYTLSSLGYAYGVSGQPAKARETLDALTELARQCYVSPDCQALVYIGLGDRDQAFAWLEKVVADRSEWVCRFRVDPVLDPLRSDPRFDALTQRINLKG